MVNHALTCPLPGGNHKQFNTDSLASCGCVGVNQLYFGDNLDVLRKMPAESVDLIYLDPPFNSKADYGVIYGTKRGGPSQAQAHAFNDLWTWGPDAQHALDQT